MNLVVNSTAAHRRELDAVPEAAIDDGLRQRLDQSTQRLAETADAYLDDPEQSQPYTDAIFMFGVLASARYEYKPLKGTRQDLLPDWLAGAQADLIKYALKHRGAENLLSTPFFSDDIGDRMDLDRAAHALIRETGPASLSARQFAAELALGSEIRL